MVSSLSVPRVSTKNDIKFVIRQLCSLHHSNYVHTWETPMTGTINNRYFICIVNSNDCPNAYRPKITFNFFLRKACQENSTDEEI